MYASTVHGTHVYHLATAVPPAINDMYNGDDSPQVPTAAMAAMNIRNTGSQSAIPSVEGSVGLLTNFPFPEEFVWTLCHTVIFMSHHIHFHLPHI